MSNIIQLVHFQITKNCNLRCYFCGQWGKKGFFSDLNGESVSYERWIEIINELYNYGISVGRLPDVILWGGEPLVSPYFTNLAYELKNKGFKVGMVTNGVFINEKITVINDCISKCYVSIDGPKKVHDAIRGDGVYEKVLSNLKLLSSSVEVEVMSVTTKNLLSNFNEFITDLSNCNVSKVILQDLICLSKQEIESYKTALSENFNINATCIDGWLGEGENLRNEIESLIKQKFPVKVTYLPHNTVCDRSCLSCNNHIHIAWNGNLTFCTDFYDFNFGNANLGSVTAQFNGELANKFRSYFEENELSTCKHCSWKNSEEFYL